MKHGSNDFGTRHTTKKCTIPLSIFRFAIKSSLRHFPKVHSSSAIDAIKHAIPRLRLSCIEICSYVLLRLVAPETESINTTEHSRLSMHTHYGSGWNPTSTVTKTLQYSLPPTPTHTHPALHFTLAYMFSWFWDWSRMANAKSSSLAIVQNSYLVVSRT